MIRKLSMLLTGCAGIGLAAATVAAPAGATGAALAARPASAQTFYTWGAPANPNKPSAGGRAGPGRQPQVKDAPTPVKGVPGRIVQIATSNSDSYALTANGTVWATGDGSRGELGNGTTRRTSAKAVRVDFPAGVTIAALPNPMPLDGGMAIDTTGTAWGWGVNGGGQFCQHTSGDILKPVKIPLTDVTLAAGALQHTVYDANGRIVTCGVGRYGQLGNGTSGKGAQSTTPVAVKGLPSGRATAVTDSWGDAGVLMASGRYYDWGYNRAGQVGDGTTTNRTTAVHVPLESAVRQVSQGGSIASNGQTMTLLANGQLWEWGSGEYGQLGRGSLSDATSPIQLTEPAGVTFVKINSGGGTNFALDSTGNLWAWGRDNLGQVGNGTVQATVKRPVSDHITLTQVSSTASEEAGYVAAAATPAAAGGTISPMLLGANGHWFDQDFGGWDPSTQSAYPAFVQALKDSGVTTVRYPSGTAANLFQWKRAIGPVADRTRQVGLSNSGFTAPEDDTFGPDEYGQLSQQLGQPGDILVNFSTATPTNAAEEVDYLTGQVGAEKIDGTDWAALRAKNGHPAPYDLPYWEVGNEMDSGHQLYWRAGKSSKNVIQLYAFGGSATFTKQLVGTFDDYRNSAAVSSGQAAQQFQAKYPPVTPGSAQVYVGKQAWTRTTPAGLKSAPADAHDYTLNYQTGAIGFGDGSHGAIPGQGANVSISYTSGPHQGFTAFYAAMKKANPDIKVCAGLSNEQATESFVKMMGTKYPYDCVQHHAYINTSQTPIPPDESPTDYYERVLEHIPGQTGEVASIEKSIGLYAGSGAKNIGVVVTEYGQLGGDPKGDHTFHQSLSQAILMSDDLISWARLGVPEADKANENGFFAGAQPPGEAVPVKGTTSDSLILRASPTKYVLTPTGLVSSLFGPLTGGTAATLTVSRNPTFAAPGGKKLAGLVTLASQQSDGTLDLLVVNQNPDASVTTRIEPGAQHSATAAVATLNGPAVTSINTAAHQPVAITSSTATVGTGNFRFTFPAHSITRIELAPAS